MNSSLQNYSIYQPGVPAGLLVTQPVHPCFPQAAVVLSIVLLLTVSPFHLLIFVVLRRQYELPQRHKFFLSLSMYDTTQIILNGFFGLLNTMFALRTDSLSCQVLRQMCEFSITATVVGASLSVVSLSMERYINCFYCMQAYQIMSNKRVKAIVITVAVISITCGCAVLHPNTPNPNARVLRNTAIPTLITTCVTLLSSLIVTIFQSRLYLLSREKLKIDAAKPKFGRAAEKVELRRLQIKVTFTASIVVVSYGLCMIPASCYNLYTFITEEEEKFTNTWEVFTTLFLLNTLADPLVYAIGMNDTRKPFLATLRRMKAALLERFVGED